MSFSVMRRNPFANDVKKVYVNVVIWKIAITPSEISLFLRVLSLVYNPSKRKFKLMAPNHLMHNANQRTITFCMTVRRRKTPFYSLCRQPRALVARLSDSSNITPTIQQPNNYRLLSLISSLVGQGYQLLNSRPIFTMTSRHGPCSTIYPACIGPRAPSMTI